MNWKVVAEACRAVPLSGKSIDADEIVRTSELAAEIRAAVTGLALAAERRRAKPCG